MLVIKFLLIPLLFINNCKSIFTRFLKKLKQTKDYLKNGILN